MTDSYFWDRIADKYAQKAVGNEDVYQQKLARTRALLTPASDVLEIGCGTGSTALTLAPHAGKIRALDLSKRMLEIAQEKARKQQIDNVIFEQSDVDQLAGENETYDMILAHNILQLLDDKDKAIQQIHRLLKPGGMFISSTACLGAGFIWLWPILRIGSYFNRIPSVRFFTRRKLENAITKAGFDIEENLKPGKMQAVFIIARKTA